MARHFALSFRSASHAHYGVRKIDLYNKCRITCADTNKLAVLRNEDVNDTCNLSTASNIEVDLDLDEKGDALFCPDSKVLAICTSEEFKVLPLSHLNRLSLFKHPPSAIWTDLEFFGMIPFEIERVFYCEALKAKKFLYYEPGMS